VESKSDYLSVASLLSYCSAEGVGEDFISGVTIGTISNTGTGKDGYSDYTNLETDVVINQSYSITVAYGAIYGGGYEDLSIWIDWNRDGDFDDTNENVVCVNGITVFSVNSIISVPIDAALGSTTMRVRCNVWFGGCGSPCGTTTYGEVEDYKINVLPATNTWIGTGTDWNTASNWSDNTVPTSSYNVTIPTSPSGSNYPVIQVGTTARCNTLTIESGAIITVNGTLEVEK
jgi:hypothetical protein